MSAREIIFNYFDCSLYAGNETYGALVSIMDYLDTDTIVAWFVDAGYVDELDDDDKEIIEKHYELHCK